MEQMNREGKTIEKRKEKVRRRVKGEREERKGERSIERNEDGKKTSINQHHNQKSKLSCNNVSHKNC